MSGESADVKPANSNSSLATAIITPMHIAYDLSYTPLVRLLTHHTHCLPLVHAMTSPLPAVSDPSLCSAQVLLPGRGGHVHGGGPAFGGGPALPPPAERAVHRGRRQTLPLRDDPGAGLPAEPAHHSQVR